MKDQSAPVKIWYQSFVDSKEQVEYFGDVKLLV
jgi:hypothetical protein